MASGGNPTAPPPPYSSNESYQQQIPPYPVQQQQQPFYQQPYSQPYEPPPESFGHQPSHYVDDDRNQSGAAAEFTEQSVRAGINERPYVAILYFTPDQVRLNVESLSTSK